MTSGLHSRESEATLQPGRAETISWTSDQPTENRSQFQLDQSERPNFEEFDKIGNGVDSKNKHHSRPFSMVSLEQSYMPSSQSRKSETNSSRDQAANGNSDEDSLRRQKTEARAASEGGPTGESKGDEEKGNAGPPKPVGFWDKSLNKTRLLVFRRWLFMTALLSAFILGILSLYWAVLFKVDDNLNSIIVFVVNFETEPDALVGPMVTQMTESIVEENAMPHLGFVTVPPSAYNYDHLAVREAIYQQEAYAGIVVNSNATTLLRQAVETGNSSYDPTGAIQLIYVEARDQDSYYNYIYPNMQLLQQQVTNEFGQKWASQVLSNTSILRSNLGKAPQALSPGIGFSTFQLRPFVPYVAVPAVSIGLIYLIIISFFSFSFFLPIHMQFIAPGHPPLKFYQVVIWRWTATIVAYFILSLAYSLVSLAYQIPFGQPTGSQYVSSADPNAFGYGTFPVYWMINYVGMIALGMACENVAMIVGMPWTALWLIFWVITNVSTSFYAIEISPGFFRWGYAWPLHNIVEASRTTLFDLHSRLGLNFGILFAWAAVNTVLFPFCCWYMRWKQMREQKKNKEQ